MAPYFKFILRLSFIVILVFAAAACRADENTPEPPPQFDKGWNLVSVPCDISLADFKQNIKEDTLKVYGWNETDYEEVKSLERGRGYFINADSVLNPSATCKPKAANENTSVTYKAGWNLIGNPYHKTATFVQLLGTAANIADIGIYELKGDQFVQVKMSEQAKPWKGYWLYSSSDTSIPIVNIYTLKIKAYKDAARTQESAYPPTILINKFLYFSAAVTSQEGPAKSETKDMTGAASWSVSNESIGIFFPGVQFVATGASGTAAITAGYDGIVSNSIDVDVLTKLPVECKNLVVAMEWKEAASHYYSSNSFYNSSSIDSTCVHYPYTYYDQPLECGVFERNSNAIVYKPGENVSIKAYCADNKNSYGSDYYLSYSNYKDVSDDVDWKIKDGSLISRNDDGTFAAKALGIPEISAVYGSAESNKLHFRIMDKKEVLKAISVISGPNSSSSLMPCSIYYYSSAIGMGCGGAGYLISKGSTGQLAAYGMYAVSLSDGSKEISATAQDGGISSNVDITGKVTWKSSDENSGDVSASGLFTARNPGTATVTAALDGVTSNNLKIRIYDNDILFISIEPANEIKVLPGSSATYKVLAWRLNDISSCSSYYTDSNCMSSEDITKLAAASLADTSLGSAANGVFTSNSKEGATVLTAEYKGIKSNGVNVIVKTRIWMVLTIISTDAGTLSNCPFTTCYYVNKDMKAHMKVLGKDEASYWVDDQDITSMATWEISDSSIVTINSGGELVGKSKGIAWIRATVGDARGDKVPIAVVEDNYEFVIIGAGSYDFKPLKPLKVGESYFFNAEYYKYHATASSDYSCGYSSNYYYDDYYYDDYYRPTGNFSCDSVTKVATWNSSDSSIAKFTPVAPQYGDNAFGMVTGASPGFADISATYKGLTSNRATLDVWNESQMKFCDDYNKNTGEWHDEHTQATLEMNCKTYGVTDSIFIRYTASLTTSDRTFLDNCLDLYIMNDKDQIVRTLREQGCSTEKLGANGYARESAPVYQNLTKWDMLDNSGKKVAPGKYYAVARFYILWEPVIRLPFNIVGK